MAKTFDSFSIDEIDTIAQAVIEACSTYPIWAFYGEMGAGKTTLIKAICKQLGVTAEISSPTFSLVNVYPLPNQRAIYHFDFYRINHIEEVYDIGYEDYFYSGDICLLEWPEKVESLLDNEPHHRITLQKVSPTERSITIA